MDIDDDDDFYAPDEAVPETKAEPVETPAIVPKTETTEDKDLEEGEEEEGEELDGGEDDDEDDDSDIDIITERKDGSKPAPTIQNKYSSIPGTLTSNKPSTPTPTKASVAQVKKETSPRTVTAPSGGGDLPPVSTSKLDINAKPIYPPANKAITAIEIDSDLPDNDKPWRRPGADVSDYFNYGFDEFTWALYATKQNDLRSEFSADKVAEKNKKMMEEMSMMMMGGGMPMGGMPGMSAPDGSAMTPEMMSMMQQMMGSGMDPSQMSEQMFAGMQGAAAGGAGQGGYGQNYGYDQGNMNSAGGGGRGNFGGGGRGRRGGRGNW